MPAIALHSSLKLRELDFMFAISSVSHFRISEGQPLKFLENNNNNNNRIRDNYILRIIQVCIIQYREDMSLREEQPDSRDNTSLIRNNRRHSEPHFRQVIILSTS